MHLYEMRFTEENIDQPFAVEWFYTFNKLLNIFLKNSKGIFGGVIRDYILPCKSLLLDPHKFDSLKMLVKKNKYIVFNDLDILINDKEQMMNIYNIIEKSEICEFCSEPRYNSKGKEIHGYDAYKMIIFANSCIKGYDEYRFNIDLVVHHTYGNNNCDFNVNNIIYTKNGYDILDYSDHFKKWVINSDERLIAQSNNINDFNWNSFMMKDICVQLIEKNIENKEAYFIRNVYRMDELDVEMIHNRFEKLLIRDYQINEFYITKNISYFTHIKNNEDIDICSICCENIEDLNIKYLTNCCDNGGNIFHLNCISKWIFNREKPNCPLCKKDWVPWVYLRD
jgi:hypothetical protein